MRKTVSITFRDDAALWIHIDDFLESGKGSKGGKVTRTDFIKVAVRQFMATQPVQENLQT